MGGAILSGLIGAGVPDLRVTTRTPARAPRAAEGLTVLIAEQDPEANRRAVAGAHVVIVAVKPAGVPALLEEIADALEADAVVVSVAVGVRIATMAQALPASLAVFRAMPNTPSAVGAGVTGVAAPAGARPEDVAAVVAAFETVGTVVQVAEDRIDALSSVSGSGCENALPLPRALHRRGDATRLRRGRGQGARGRHRRRCPAPARGERRGPRGAAAPRHEPEGHDRARGGRVRAARPRRDLRRGARRRDRARPGDRGGLSRTPCSRGVVRGARARAPIRWPHGGPVRRHRGPDTTRAAPCAPRADGGRGQDTGEASVGELVSRLSLSQPTVSKHLKTLREFSIVSVREQGQHRYYRLKPAQLEPIAEWLGAFVKPVVAAAEPVAAETMAVAAATPTHPLSPKLRATAVRLGAMTAGVAGRFSRTR